MKKQQLLEIMDDALLEKLYGFCYARTKDSFEAQELCSDIVFELVKAANTEGEVEHLYPFIWHVARNVYADFSAKRSRNSLLFYEGSAEEEIFPFLPDAAQEEPADDEMLTGIYRRIAFLAKAYREVMILYYLDGKSTAQIAEQLNTSEGAVRQRLFSARKKLRNEVEEMAEIQTKPMALNQMDYVIWGTGNPGWGDPRNVCQRQFSKHIIWLCRKKAMTATEIAAELNVPTVYVEEEMEILTKGENGKYGLLRKTDNGKYAINFILLERKVIEKAHSIYIEQIPQIADSILGFIEENQDAYLAFPYLNKKVDLNLILWQQLRLITDAFSDKVSNILTGQYFADQTAPDRPFIVYGYEKGAKDYGAGWDGIDAQNVCGYSRVHWNNIYSHSFGLKAHFHCGHDVANDNQLQLTIRAIHGLEIGSLSEAEKEHAAKAIDCGYLFREGETLYTKILVSDRKDAEKAFDITHRLSKGYFDQAAQAVAEKIAKLIKASVPEYLLGEWEFANYLAGAPLFDLLTAKLIEKGVITMPPGGLGAEGCWMTVKK